MPSPYTLLLAPNASLMTGSGTNTIVLGADPHGALVIDPGDAAPAHLAAIVEEGVKRGGLRRVLITHNHPDHSSGAAELRERLHIPIAAFSYTGTPFADEEIADGSSFAIADDTLRALHTPGHRFDHLCFLLERQHLLFAGDLLAGSGTVVISPPEGDLFDYLASLRRLQNLDITTMIPAHGPIIADPQARLAEYVAHRLQREQQVLAALHDLPPGSTVAALVERIYAEVDPALHTVAAHSVTAHLLKLEREGRVQRDGEGWRIIA
ncbi:MAG TPA: MBL fold metallo-hydrolase [Ktedonobacteraceae bacterium]|nr:MBL fold metallo-hydrolase [Ktedonobacteraceae bacterium]